jgi:hypothetical protein
VSPSLKNLLLSVLAGGSVLAVIAVGVVAVSSFDKARRGGSAGRRGVARALHFLADLCAPFRTPAQTAKQVVRR